MQAQKLLDNFLDTLQEWKSFLSGYSLSDLQECPSAREWSLGQVYRHLIDETGFYRDHVVDCLACKTITEEGPTRDAADMLARNSFPAIRINGPLTGVFIPQPDSMEALVSEIDGLAASFNAFYQEPALENEQCRSRHPGLGFFTAKQWLQFADMHFRHHLHQKRRIDQYLKSRQAS